MAFVVARLAIASVCAAVIRVRSHSYARKSNWKRAVFESDFEGLSVDWLRVSDSLEKCVSVYAACPPVLSGLWPV